MRRHTIRSAATLQGRGLFTGAPSTITLRPAGEGGLCVVTGGLTIPIHIGSLKTDQAGSPFPVGVHARNTTLARGGVMVCTVEHLASALAGLGITDLVAEVIGPEVPIFDGSAERFIEAISAAGGLEPLPGDVEPIRLRERVEARNASGAMVVAEPCRGETPTVTYDLDYGPASPLGRQIAAWDGRAASYQIDVAAARTFCLATEAAAMRAKGLFLDLSPKDFLVLDDATGKPVQNTLRFPDEPARHKLLDVIGDLALLGRPLHADVRATRSGHALTHELCRRILATL